MQPEDIQTSKSSVFYVLENQNKQFCDVDAGNNQTVDSRFTYLGL